MVNSPVQIQTWIKKVLLYEQNPGKGDFNYLAKAFFTQADQLLQGNEANIVLNRATWIPSANRVIFNEEGGSNTGSVPAFPTGKAVIDDLIIIMEYVVLWGMEDLLMWQSLLKE